MGLPRVGGLHHRYIRKRRSDQHSPYFGVDQKRRTGLEDPQVTRVESDFIAAVRQELVKRTATTSEG